MKKKLLMRLALIFVPAALVIAVELFLLPIDFFTFRCWEALWVDNRDFFNGCMFYPRMELEKVEEGDLAPHTPYAVKKKVRWVTDRYGFRKQDTGNNAFDVVIIGDSMTLGTSLSQEEMLSEVLERKTGARVYPYAPYRDINQFLAEPRFVRHRPAVVVLETIERNIPDLPELEAGQTVHEEKPPRGRLIERLQIVRDRFDKQLMYNYVKKRVVSFDRRTKGTAYPADVREFFYQGSAAMLDLPDEKIDGIARRIIDCRDRLAREGIRFVFLPVPNKESIYYRLVPPGARPVFLDKLMGKLNAAGVEVADVVHPFEDAYSTRGTRFFHADDSHWNAQGASLAADILSWHLRAQLSGDNRTAG